MIGALTGVALAGALVFGAAGDGLFELDGDATDSVSAGTDWQNAVAAGGFIARTANPADTTEINIPDPAPGSIFTQGGSKDINDISQWRWTNGSVPDKDNITNAFAIAYKSTNTDGSPALVAYFGQDRFANNGDALMGFWFFKSKVGLVSGSGAGTFTGLHQTGDVFVVAALSNGGATATIDVYEWDPTVTGNLRLLGTAGNAICSGGSNILNGDGGTNFCAISNPDGTPDFLEPAYWPYTPKAGAAGSYPPFSFFEGGINLSAVLAGTGSNTCFSSFMAETRSSRSPSAQLKDFVLGEFDTCGSVKVTKVTKGPGASPVNVNDPDSTFTYTLARTAPSAATIADQVGIKGCQDVTSVVDGCGGTTDTYTDLLAGSYSLTEKTPLPTVPFYDSTKTTIACVDTTTNASVGSGGLTATITLSESQHVLCTITNYQVKGTPTVATQPTVNALFYDSATIVLGRAIAPNTTKTVSISLWADAACKTTQVGSTLSRTLTIGQDGKTGSVSTLPQSGVGDGFLIVQKDTPYYWKVEYPGDDQNFAGFTCGELTKYNATETTQSATEVTIP
jgi:hypothetical protein